MNVDVVERLLAWWTDLDGDAAVRDEAAWARQRPELEAIFEPDCVLIWIGGGAEKERTGLDGLRRGWLDFFGAGENTRTGFDAIIPVGHNVILLTRQCSRLPETDKEVELLGAGIYLVRDGRVARAEFYADRAEAFEALEAVGLSEAAP